MRYLIVTAGAVAAFLSFGSGARADISVCNDFVATVHVAFAYPNGEKVTAAGWWSVDPKKCADVNFPFTGATLYYTANSDNYKQGRKTYHDHWGNKKELYVTSKKFNTDDAQSRRRGTKGQMFSLFELAKPLQGKPVQITFHFQKGSTSINAKGK